LAALVEHLMSRDYSPHAIGRIFDYVACNGTLEGSLVEPDDMAEAEACFVDALPPLDYASPCLGSDDDLDGLDIPPISGGSPEPFEPDASDLPDYAAWSEQLDRLRDLEEQRQWYRRNRIEGFNRDRCD
jgi:hypothetical protein